MACFSCGEDTLIHYEHAGGHSVCTGCGAVLEENAIVSEISFGETSGGAAMVQGSYVGADQTRARAPAGYRQNGGQESREQTILNGRRRIQTLAAALRLPDRLADAGQRYFNLAVNMNFVQGRRTQYVVAACLYSACRVDKTSHMLIDFSDLLEINVFVLGSTYLKLVKELSLNLPSVDPSLYISRFAALLEFGDETQKVAQDAVRLVARMARDWMHIGRRPSGICGACLLLAARMNNFRRSITEVVQVVKIADVTLRKRLGEFKETASGKLTVDDFRTLWLDEVSDPPAFAKSQQREKKLRDEEQAARLERAKDVDLVAEFDVLVGVAPADVLSDAAEVPSDVADAPSEPADVPSEAASDSAADEAGMAPPVISRKAMGKRKRVNQNDSGDEAMAIGDLHLENPVVDDVITAEVEVTLASTTLTLELDEAQKKKSAAAAAMTNLKLDTNDSLDDLDEAELDNFLLTPAEVAAKSRLWMEFNKDYLQALADKETGPDGELKPMTKVKPRKRNKPRDSLTALGTTAADSTKQMLTKRKFSKKINYKAIENLFGDKVEGEGQLFDSSPSRSSSVVPGAPIHIPRNTFSRAGSVTPSRRSVSVVVPVAFVDVVDADDHDVLDQDAVADAVPEEYELEAEAYQAE